MGLPAFFFYQLSLLCLQQHFHQRTEFLKMLISILATALLCLLISAREAAVQGTGAGHTNQLVTPALEKKRMLLLFLCLVLQLLCLRPCTAWGQIHEEQPSSIAAVPIFRVMTHLEGGLQADFQRVAETPFTTVDTHHPPIRGQ